MNGSEQCNDLKVALSELGQVKKELRDMYREREEVIDGMLACLIAKQHCVLMGSPGEGKSALLTELCSRVEGATFWKKMMTRFTSETELIGGIDQKEYVASGTWQRVKKGTVRGCSIAFADEVFKANSAALNVLLPIINEREWDGESLPMEFFVGASNELPDGYRQGKNGKPVVTSGDDLGALWDRFTLRYFVNPVRSEQNLHDIVFGIAGSGQSPKATISEHSMNVLRTELESRCKDTRLWDKFLEAKAELSVAGMDMSTRRTVWVWRMIHSFSIVDCQPNASAMSMRCLAHSAWVTEDQIQEAREVISEIGSGIAGEVNAVLEAVKEKFTAYTNAVPSDQARMAGGLVRALKNAKAEIESSYQRSVDAHETCDSDEMLVESAIKDINAWHKRILDELT